MNFTIIFYNNSFLPAIGAYNRVRGGSKRAFFSAIRTFPVYKRALAACNRGPLSAKRTFFVYKRALVCSKPAFATNHRGLPDFWRTFFSAKRPHWNQKIVQRVMK